MTPEIIVLQKKILDFKSKYRTESKMIDYMDYLIPTPSKKEVLELIRPYFYNTF